MSYVVVDTDVLAIHHVFTWDKRHATNEEFLNAVERPATTVHNVLELVGIVCKALRKAEARSIYDAYMLSKKWAVLFPEMPLGWDEFCDFIFPCMERVMSYGAALIAWTVDENADVIEAFVTWNKKHFSGKLGVPVRTPKEWLEGGLRA